MTKNAKIGSKLIQYARERGDHASVSALFEYYKDSFKASAMVHFKRHFFDCGVLGQLGYSKYKQGIVLSAAYDAFVEAYRTYDASCKASFETWLSRKIEWYFMDLQRDSVKYNQRMLKYVEEREISEGGSVLYQNEKYKRLCDIENAGRAFRSIHNACDTDMVNAVLKSMPKEGAARKNAEALYQIFSEEGYDKPGSVAGRLGVSREAISKSFRLYRKNGPKRIREKVLEALNS